LLLYRVFAHLPTASAGDPGSPDYVHLPQGAGRWDNPALYSAWYFSTSPEGAIAETFGNLQTWTTAMFETPFLSGSRRALGVFSVDDALPVLDLDDAHNLLEQGLRPTQVVIRNAPFTQARAAGAFDEIRGGSRRWAGIKWWSFHRPYWSNIMLWQARGESLPASPQRVEPLDLTHAALVDCASTLAKPLP
jgi:hypothetical protein